MNGIDFGYPWYITYGHLVVAAIAALALLAAIKWRAGLWLRFPLGLLLLWSLGAFAVMMFVAGIDNRATMPTAAYLRSGAGSVIDLGAGTGRSALMVLENRPLTTITAVDAFANSYEHHFKIDEKAPTTESAGHAKLQRNFELAGVASRTRIETCDIRTLKFPDESFDAAVSAYAIDHLRSSDVPVCLREARRVLKPSGEFLLMVINKDNWMRFAFGPIAMHTNFRSPERWSELLRDAGFRVLEHGQQPITLYFLSRRE